MTIPTGNAIELTIPISNPSTPDFLREAMADFARKRNRPVEITGHPWGVAWQELVKVALYKTGADVSGIGTTWIGSFVGMEALRPFSQREIANLGGEAAYFTSAWQASRVIANPQIWSIPYVLDARVIFYWRDMLERAGVAESHAFQTAEQIDETCHRLQASGVATPWADETGGPSPLNTFYFASSWVWAKGGDFISADGKHAIFNSAEARAGLRAYYDLYRYMPHEPAPETGEDVTDLFFDRRVAAIITGPWIFERERYRNLPADTLSRMGAALLPGPSFVGGVHLAAWAHVSPHIEPDVIELVRYLSAPQIQVSYAQQIGLLPARLDALQQPPFATDPHLQIFVKALETGRAHTRIPLWGMVEDRLSTALSAIWTSIKQNPQQDLDVLISEQMEPLADRLDMLLSR